MLPVTVVRYETQTKTVQDLLNLYRNRDLNLEPAFQRDSVWNDRDRAKLINSILRGYPVPALFFSKNINSGHVVYDVIDGKQRIESILRFCGAMRGKFAAKVDAQGDDGGKVLDWTKLRQRGQQHRLTGYKLQVIEVEGDLSEVIELFVRINSTGKALTGQEKRHARYYRSAFLARAAKLARSLEKRLRAARIVSAVQVTRKKHIELMCELMLSAHQQGVVHKKAALDKVMDSKSITLTQVSKSAKATMAAVNRIARMLPNLKQTRFRQLADYYSLTVLVQKLEREGLALADRRRLRLAGDLLTAFATGVDTVQDKHRKLEGMKPAEQLYGDYLLTVKEGTDALLNRRRREVILEGLLRPLFERKDQKRTFSPEQRRIMWNTSAERRCRSCGKRLTWDDFTIDHIHPHSKGGRTHLANAALLCRRHNAKKGNRTRGRARPSRRR